MMNRRDFIKSAALGFFAVNTIGLFPEKVFAADNLKIKTRYGTFNGFLDKNGVKTWLGIPFAQPPVKKLHWQAPQPLKPANKSFDAKKIGFADINGFYSWRRICWRLNINLILTTFIFICSVKNPPTKNCARVMQLI